MMGHHWMPDGRVERFLLFLGFMLLAIALHPDQPLDAKPGCKTRCVEGVVALRHSSSLLPTGLATCAQGQVPASTIAGQDLYSQALFASLREAAKQWGHIDDGDNGARIRTDYHNMPAEEFPGITDKMPRQVEDFHIEYLDRKGEVDRYGKLHKEYCILIIGPMKNEGSHLKIEISFEWIKYTKRKLWHEVSDWSIVYFRYDCATQGFVVDEVKLGGI
jgi:hypothetical protein